jgi:tetratricopeptide (TPR) repeat protein
VAHNALGQVHYLARDYDRSVRAYEMALDLDRGDPSAYYCLAWPHEQMGDVEGAIELHRQAVELSAGAPLFLSGLAYAYAKAGREEEARDILAELEMPFHRARVHAGLGEVETAIDLLEQAFEARTSHLMYINRGPQFDPLRGDDRFEALIERMGW